MATEITDRLNYERIEVVQDYIEQHLHEPLKRDVLAEVSGFSIPHFHRVFTACVGESAISYVRRIRMIRAGQKLRMGAVDITHVALCAGYDSHAAFGKSFKKFFGMCPSEFRKLSCHEATQLLRQRRYP